MNFSKANVIAAIIRLEKENEESKVYNDDYKMGYRGGLSNLMYLIEHEWGNDGKKVYTKNTNNNAYQYPEDMKKILNYLDEHGTRQVSESTVEKLYERFSEEIYCAGWMSAEEYILPEFADWLSNFEIEAIPF